MRLSLLFFMLFSNLLFAQKSDRLITDFNGVATNGKVIVCYGDYGIITASGDYGQAWQQEYLGDNHNIRKIVSRENEFFGATDYCLIRSNDRGQLWVKGVELPDSMQIIDVEHHTNILYVLTKNGVWTADNDLQLSAKPLIELNTGDTYTDLAISDTTIAIINNNRFITTYSFNSQLIVTTSVFKAIDNNDVTSGYLSHLEFSGSNLYVMVNKQFGTDNYGQYLAQSGDGGKTWKVVSPYLFDGNSYIIENEKKYFIRPTKVNSNGRSLLTTQFYTVDSTHFAIDSSYFTFINNNDTVEREVYFSNNGIYSYTGIAKVNKDTLVAVGTNKLISLSYDGGRSWQLRSFLRASVPSGVTPYVQFTDDKHGYMLTFGSYFTTNDGGITWLPQRHRADFSQIISDPFMYFFGDGGKGYVSSLRQNIADTNVFATDDFGETYHPYYIDSLYKRFIPISARGVDAGGVILYAGNPRIVNGNTSTAADYSLILRYDANMRFIDSVRLNVRSIEMASMVRASDGNIYVLGLNTSGENKADSAGNTENYTYSYLLLKSSDKGLTWDSVSLPIKQDLVYSSFSGTYRYSDRLFNRYSTVQGDYILYPTVSGLLYRYNYRNSTFDSIQLPGNISSNKNTIFTFGANVYAVSRANDLLYYTPAMSFSGSNIIWDSISVSTLLPKWENLDPQFAEFGQDAILSVEMLNDSTGFMIIGKLSAGLAGNNYTINVVRLLLRSTTTDITETTQSNRIYLWNSPPYPLPGKNTIASRIYWDSRYDIATATIDVFDMSGAPIPNQKVTLNKLQDYRGLLQWDCGGVADGMYIIKITLSGESLTFPVIVAK